MESVPPYLNFAPLENAIDTLSRSARAYDQAATHRKGDSSALPQINAVLLQTERQLLSSEGLPRRPWYRHLIYAPGVYTGYDAKTLPGVREGIEQKRYEEAAGQITAIARALINEAIAIDRATELLCDEQ
jgi:N-acetylated-alpha-linked acidic dipeptidase